MNENMKMLKQKFIEIKKRGWIKSLRPGPTGIGYTFENLIGKEEDCFAIADYKGIEIKTKRTSSKYNIHLFTAAPDGDYLFPKERILECLGYPDKIKKQYKVCYMTVNAKEYTSIGHYKQAKLTVNRNERKISLIAINNYGRNLSIDTSWSFKLIEAKLYTKLRFLAIINADSMFLGKIKYFDYLNIDFYKLISFDTFINLVESGHIVVTFKIGVYRDGEKEGHIYDHGVDFSISYPNIEKLYNKINL